MKESTNKTTGSQSKTNKTTTAKNVAFQQQLDQSRCRIDGFFEPRYRPQSIFGFEPQRFAQQQSRRSQSVHEEIDRFHRNRSM